MADELLAVAKLAYSKAGVTVSPLMMLDSFDVSGSDIFRGTQTIGTSAEALNIGDITTPGWLIIKNLDATNYIELRDGSGGADLVKLKAGEFALFRLATTTPYAIANTASCIVDYLVIED